MMPPAPPQQVAPAHPTGMDNLPPISEIAALLARMSATGAPFPFSAGVPSTPIVSTEDAPVAPLGDVSNVMSPSKSPTKRQPSNSPLGRRSPVLFGSENP